jgi:acyl carrier protein
MAAPMIDQLRELIVQVGGNAQTVLELEPDQAVAHNALDSFGFTAFIVAIEERFAIRVSDKSSVKLRSLNDFAQYVEAQLERPVSSLLTERRSITRSQAADRPCSS